MYSALSCSCGKSSCKNETYSHPLIKHTVILEMCCDLSLSYSPEIRILPFLYIRPDMIWKNHLLSCPAPGTHPKGWSLYGALLTPNSIHHDSAHTGTSTKPNESNFFHLETQSNSIKSPHQVQSPKSMVHDPSTNHQNQNSSSKSKKQAQSLKSNVQVL